MRVGGARPPPLITFTLTSKVAVYAPAEWADTLTLFHLYQYVYSVLVLANKATNDAHTRSGISVSFISMEELPHDCVKAWNGKKICKCIILQRCAHNITAQRYV